MKPDQPSLWFGNSVKQFFVFQSYEIDNQPRSNINNEAAIQPLQWGFRWKIVGALIKSRLLLNQMGFSAWKLIQFINHFVPTWFLFISQNWHANLVCETQEGFHVINKGTFSSPRFCRWLELFTHLFSVLKEVSL